MNIVLMAGGGGTRLWPLSRQSKPKQFLDLGTGKSLLEHTYDRAAQVAKPADIFVATTQQYHDQVKEALPDLPDENIFLETDKRDTAAAFGAVAVQLQMRGKGTEPVIFMWSDHVFGDEVMEIARNHTPEPGHAALLVDYKLDTVFDMDDATKVAVSDGKVVSIDKQLVSFNAVDTGVFVCTDGLMDALQALDDEAGDASLSDGVRRLAKSGKMHALDIGDGFWQDVDTPEMMAHAEKVLAERGMAL